MRPTLCLVLLGAALLASCAAPDGTLLDDDDVLDDDDAVDDDDATGDDDDATGDDDDAPDQDGDGYSADVDCDDNDPELHPGIVPSLVVADPELSLFWIGQPSIVEAVPVTVLEAGCLDVSAESDADWLVPSFSGSFTTVLIKGARVVGGVHEVTVTLRHDESGTVLAEFPVEVRALGSASADNKRALVVGIDGTRGDSIGPAATPALDDLRLHAAWTVQASTQLQASTVSGPGWTSILTGVDSDKHGITGNSNMANHDPTYPTWLLRLQGEGMSTAAWTSWDPIFDEIIESGATTVGGVGSDVSVTDDLSGALTDDDFDAHFIHLDDVDGAGHGNGYSPVVPAYTNAIGQADTHVGQLIDAILARPAIADEQWLVIVTSDHGGINSGHGCLTWECREIPFIVAGPSVIAGEPPGFVSHMDVGPTVLDFLGVGIDPAWGLDGLVVGGAVETDCDDGVDNDGDGDIDCDDADCGNLIACSCPQFDLGTAEGNALATGNTSGETDELSGSCGGGGAPELTYGWTAPSTDTWTFDLTGSDHNFDTVLYALDGCGGSELDCNADASDVQSALVLELEAGDEIVLVVDGAGSQSGPLRLNAEALSSCPDVDAGSAVGASVATGSNLDQGGTFFASCARSGRDALIGWTAPADGTFTFDTDGSDYDTVLAVRDGLCTGPELACNDDGMPGYLSSLDVALTSGQQVTVVLSGFNGRPEGPGDPPNNGGGNWVLNVSGP